MTDEQRQCPYPVLIAEDNALLRAVLEGSLREIGYDVVAAIDGKDALSRIQSGYFPLVITDWVMPVMDGPELCRTVRSLGLEHYTYLILLTSRDSKESIISGLEAGADEYLVKPVTPEELTVRLMTARRIIDLESSLKQSMEEVRLLTMRDPLTGIYNRRYLEDRLHQEVKRTFRYERPISVVMFDIDHFKRVNDTWGHLVGDQVLKACAESVRSGVRENIDWPVRYGGEEFVVVLPETDMAGAVIVAERLRQRIALIQTSVGDGAVTVTASFGVASFTPPDQKEDLSIGEVLLERADRCLYRAKGEGRNRVCSEQL